MTDTEQTTIEKKEETKATEPKERANTAGPRRRVAGRGRGGRRPMRKTERFKPEFDQKIIDIRRVSRVMAGGRRFSFRVSVVIGNRQGRVGVGLGKGTDTALAIEKAVRNARKNMITVKLTKGMSINHEISAKYGAAQVDLRPAPGKGLVAGSSVRNVLDLAGITDITAKVLSRSKNKLNNARVTMKALSTLK